MACNTITQLPQETDINLVRGDDLTVTISVNLDLTGYTLAASAGDEVLTLTPIDLAAGSLSLTVTAAQTEAIDDGQPWSFSWLDDAGDHLTVLVGKMRFKAVE